MTRLIISGGDAQNYLQENMVQTGYMLVSQLCQVTLMLDQQYNICGTRLPIYCTLSQFMINFHHVKYGTRSIELSPNFFLKMLLDLLQWFFLNVSIRNSVLELKIESSIRKTYHGSNYLEERTYKIHNISYLHIGPD